jgi:ribosomal protein S12 methylthiotransferase accessory factor
MEAIERHAGESYAGPIVRSSTYNLRGDYPCVDPLEIHAPLIAGYSEDLLLEWVPGFDLLNRQSVLVPLNCVVAPYRPLAGEQLFFTSTNGLASGNTRLEALCHALCEVVERDAMAVALARSAVRPVVTSILAEMGFGGEAPRESGVPDLSLEGLPRKAAALVRKLQQAGLAIRLRNLTSNTGIPTISCTIVDPQAPPTALNAHSGCGTHPDARIALTRALTEAAQTRVTFIQGGREDLAEMAPNRGASSASEPQTAERTIAFDEIDSCEHSTINEDVEFMLGRLRRSGFGQAIVVDLTKAGIGIPVVRVVVPRAETWSFFFVHTGRASVGSRALEQIHAPG